MSVPDNEVVARIHELKSDPDTDSGYQKTARLLMLAGYYIGPKKTQRIMAEEGLLAPRRKAAKRTYVKYRVVTPERPLHVLEMDIKSKWITRERRNGYILTILATFTRQALYWQAGLCMTQHQVTHAWESDQAPPATRRPVEQEAACGSAQRQRTTVHRFHGAGLLQGKSLGPGLHTPIHAPREWAHRELPCHLGRMPGPAHHLGP